MSDDLNDEVEAINSIYGPQTLLPSPDDNDPSDPTSAVFILNLPGDESSSLKIFFPGGYPASEPPRVLGTHSSSGGRRGAGARDLSILRVAIREVFTEGVVCVFDAVEEFQRRLEEVTEEEASRQETQGDGEGGGGDGGFEDGYEEEEIDLSSLPAPPWTVSEPFVDTKSTFVAHVAPVTSPDQARLYVAQLLASDRRIRDATHNMTAWRIRGSSSNESKESNVSYQDCDDDGETAAGSRLLHLMQLMDLWDAMVVVTRWYGGVKLGPRRFAVINAAARDGFVRAGMVVEKEKDGGKKKGK